jgi:hypothetical protein
VKITIDKERTEINVSGSDTTWAYGQIARIEAFLTSRGAVPQSPRYENVVSAVILGFFVALGLFWFLYASKDNQTMADCARQIRDEPRNDKFLNAFITLVLLSVLFLVLYQILKRRASRAQLKVDTDIPIGSWWERLSPGEKIAAIGIPLGALATVAAVASAASDVWK